MSNMGYARLLLPVEEVPSGALIYVLKRQGSLTRFIHRKTNNVYEASLGEKSLLWFPKASTILTLLSDHTPVGIMWQSGKDGGWYTVNNMQFGVRVNETVPVFVNGKKAKGKRQISYTRHVKIRARTFDQAVYFLFFATLGGKLCRKNIHGDFEYLYWDKLESRFKTEVKKDESW